MKYEKYDQYMSLLFLFLFFYGTRGRGRHVLTFTLVQNKLLIGPEIYRGFFFAKMTVIMIITIIFEVQI